MNYHAYELAHSFIAPMRMMAHGFKMQLEMPTNPFAKTPLAKSMSAACEVFADMTKRYAKPEFGLTETMIHGLSVPVHEEIVLDKPFCKLLHFRRDAVTAGERHDPKVLIVAPMSGHYATLLRGTVEAMLPEHDVFITDWVDARDVPVSEGPFDLDDFIDHVIEFVQFLGKDTHIIAVCQPAVPVLAATAVMAKHDDPFQPASLTLMGGPIDTRRNPTAVNDLAERQPMSWFENNVISYVPFPNAGFMRRVYPGFVQLTGFMQMNLERHTQAHVDLFNNLVQGDCDSVKQHKDFYEEYMAVMDLPAEFYLQTIRTVFKDHALPDGTMMHRGELVDCSEIRKTALLTVEGERDDICGLGQTEAAHALCTNIADADRYHYVQTGVGHYGVFNGTRWRTEIQPRIRETIRGVQFKRRTGNGDSANGSSIGLPYRSLQDDREEEIKWNADKKSGDSGSPATGTKKKRKPRAKAKAKKSNKTVA